MVKERSFFLWNFIVTVRLRFLTRVLWGFSRETRRRGESRSAGGQASQRSTIIVPAMGVTAQFFAFDPRVQTTPPTIERWIEAGALDGDLEVMSEARAWLKAIDTPFGDNKRWYDNLAGDFAWTRAREHVAPGPRAELDAWFSHFFWDAPEGRACPCGHEPTLAADHQVVFDAALLEHLRALERPLEAMREGLSIEFDGDPPKSPRVDRPWIYDFDGFRELVHEHQRVVTRALEAGRGWSLLRWVWF